MVEILSSQNGIKADFVQITYFDLITFLLKELDGRRDKESFKRGIQTRITNDKKDFFRVAVTKACLNDRFTELLRHNRSRGNGINIGNFFNRRALRRGSARNTVGCVAMKRKNRTESGDNYFFHDNS